MATVSINHQPVSDTLLVTDTGLTAEGTCGFWRRRRVMHGDRWTMRAEVTGLTTDTEALLNPLCNEVRTLLFAYADEALALVPVPDLSGTFGAAVPVTWDYARGGHAIFRGEQVYAVQWCANPDPGGGEIRGWVEFRVLSPQGTGLRGPVRVGYNVVLNEAMPEYAAWGAQQLLTPPAIAMSPTTWTLFVAVPEVYVFWHWVEPPDPPVLTYTYYVRLYCSHDQGATWQDMGTVKTLDGPGEPIPGTTAAAVQYPMLWCDRDLWLAAWYGAAPWEGAEGHIKVWRYLVQETMHYAGPASRTEGLLTVGGWPVIAGPGDTGRPGIIRRPGTGEVIVVAPKNSSSTWDDLPGVGAAVAEYVSPDTGTTWQGPVAHAVG